MTLPQLDDLLVALIDAGDLMADALEGDPLTEQLAKNWDDALDAYTGLKGGVPA